jgi:hypothetical protein
LNNVTFYFLNSNKEQLILKFNNPILNKNKFYEQPPLTKVEGTLKVRDLFKFNLNVDEKSVNILENNIKESLLFHENFLSLNLPSKIEVEIVRETKTEQLEHYLRKDNKLFFKTIQELFLSEKEKDRKNKQDKISAESIQTDSLLQNTPRLKLSIDYAKDFNSKKPPLIFDKFLTELRKSVPDTNQSKKTNESSQIITELMVLHESAHIILDNKTNKTYLKLAYEIKDKTYDGSSLQQFERLIHEGFSDGITTYLAKEHYTNSEVSQCYRNARYKTKHKTEHKDKLNIYDTVGVIDKVIHSKELNQNNAISIVFELAIDNALNKLKEKLESSEKFKSSFMQDLKYLQDKNGIKLDESILDSLRNNLLEQLSKPLPIVEILKSEESMKPKMQVCKNMDSILNEFRKTSYISESKLKR